VLTLGVEEEFLLLDPVTWHNVPAGPAVRTALPDDLRELSRPEFRLSMVEMVTPVCTGLAELRRHLVDGRAAAAKCADACDARLVAVAATPLAEPDRTVTDEARYHAISRHYGPIAHDPAVCGMHVHVGVPDRELAVQVCNHLRVWLPVVQAMAVNSPLYAGADTGHASWRALQLERWPTLGPTPRFEDAGDFDDTVAGLVAAGAMLDPTMVLWYARPSDTYPTVEVRVADVCTAVDDTVLLAGLIRALVAAVLDDIGAGLPAPAIRDQLVEAAHWNAGHDGLDGMLFDLRSGRARPAWDLVDDLRTKVGPALRRHGDDELIPALLARLRNEGTGAARQRRVFERAGNVGDVMAELAARTVDA
jgi:carboxylate-amine ligase